MGPIMGWRVYRTDFIAHYILPLPYPDHLTRGTQVVLGSLAVSAFVGWRVNSTAQWPFTSAMRASSCWY
jgi:hypothetical protein